MGNTKQVKPAEKPKAVVKPTPMKAVKPMSKLQIPPEVMPQTPLKAIINTIHTRPMTPGTPKTPKTVQAKVKPAWKRQPPAAHSGVPVPEKMRLLFDKLRREKLALAAKKANVSAPE